MFIEIYILLEKYVAVWMEMELIDLRVVSLAFYWLLLLLLIIDAFFF